MEGNAHVAYVIKKVLVHGGGGASVWLTHGGLDRHVEVCSRTCWWNMKKVYDSRALF